MKQWGGVIEVETELGKGTRFIVRLPLTLSIIQALLVEVSNEIFAIPLSSVQEIIDIPLYQILKCLEEGSYSLQGRLLIPLVRLEQELGIESDDVSDDELITLVVIKKGEKLSGLTIGDLIGQQEIVIKS